VDDTLVIADDLGLDAAVRNADDLHVRNLRLGRETETDEGRDGESSHENDECTLAVHAFGLPVKVLDFGNRGTLSFARSRRRLPSNADGVATARSA